MDSLYSLVPRIRKPRICRGDKIQIELYITGYGSRIRDNKLHILYSSPFLDIDEDNKVGNITFCVKSLLDNNGNITGILTGNNKVINKKTDKLETAIQTVLLDATGMTITLNSGYFLSFQELNEILRRPVDRKDKTYIGECKYDNHPPILINLNTSKKAPPGDHMITFTLFYSDNNVIKLDQKHIIIHINNWIEQHSKLLQIVAITLGLVALISGIVQTYYTVLQYFISIS